jgi:superfamily II DNA or RNA helicase/HKD family nuclease
MPRRQRGLYEQLLTPALKADLDALSEGLTPEAHDLRGAEAADRIALHVARLVQRALESVPENERASAGVQLVERLTKDLDAENAKLEAARDALMSPANVLRSILGRRPDGQAESIESPLIPLLDTTLLTNAPGEPSVGSQVRAEIDSADRIDVVMAFIRRSGITPLLGALARHCRAGRPLRVLTTTYTRSTEARALDELKELGADVRVSYDDASTRLHAKAWLFHRESGFSTGYIGSSNLTHSAQVTGLEWNVRVSSARNRDVVDKVAAVFESYWNGRDFVPYVREDFLRHLAAAAPSGPQVFLSPVELRAEPFQERLLEQLELSRAAGHHRNLLAAATGTGKTVMAALDYARLRQRLPRARLLFVAHREEILSQSLATFRHALRDHAFGELWVGGERPEHFEHVFASIQSITASGLNALDPKHFDVVIVDEFHHAAAETYERLLERVQPAELLGLTATPERADGLPVLHWFGDRIAAELRLWDAIDQGRLSPFSYFGIHDGMDLRSLPWRRGQGYDVEGLTNLLTANDAWARHVLQQVARYVDDARQMRALGFCVSVDHARYMARVFQQAGIPSVAVWANSPAAERREALAQLRDRKINVVFSVDLFNEGVDVPVVDTVLLLRPTDSATLFLQQLGRGLRKARDKSQCTVLDFVGHHRKEFRFDRRFRALLGGTRRDVEQQVEAGFPFLPAGCHLELDAVARDIVLRSIREAVPSNWTEKVTELRALAKQGARPSLGAYLRETGCELDDIYRGNRSWSELCADAGMRTARSGPSEEALRRAVGRLLHVDDHVRLGGFRELLEADSPPKLSALQATRERRLLRMLLGSLLGTVASKDTSVEMGAQILWNHPQVRAELLELLDVLAGQVDHLQAALATHPNAPLQVHARYSRVEILAAFGVGDGARVAPWQTGIYRVEEERADLAAFTLDKTTGQFSPTTRYRDYAISRDLIHWESQSVTRADSETGRRYQTHKQTGDTMLMFARLRSDDRAFWFLGPADYVSHQGEKPMAVTWRLHHPLPGDLYESFAAAVA